MPYSILILDDEPLILDGLTQKVDWPGMNCRVIGAALNGLEGKRLMETLCPDIVISDIMMPGLTGMDLAELNYHKKYACKFIVLSAYNDFAFAQKAIRYQVEDYILKPIEFQKLMQAVKHAIEGIEEIRSKERKVQQLEEDMLHTKDLASASLLFNLARYSENPLNEKNIHLNNYMLFQQGVFLCTKVYNIRRGQDSLLLGIIQTKIIRRFQENGTMILWGSADDKLIFLCQIEDNVDGQTACDRIAALTDQLMAELAQEEQVTCVSVISDIYKTKEKLNDCYHESLERLKDSFFAIRSGVLKERAKRQDSPELELMELLHHLKHGNQESMKEEYRDICKKLKENRNVEFATHILKEIHHQSTKTASGAGMIQKPSMDNNYMSMNYYQLSSMIESYLQTICEYIGGGQNLIGKVKLIIEEHYEDSQFNLSFVAQKLDVSSSYLSRLFKKETGENFIDYLVDCRIKKAVYLLETTKLKNAEIAVQVGFEDERYFGKVFKKKCEVTPKQYREQQSRKIT